MYNNIPIVDNLTDKIEVSFFYVNHGHGVALTTDHINWIILDN